MAYVDTLKIDVVKYEICEDFSRAIKCDVMVARLIPVVLVILLMTCD